MSHLLLQHFRLFKSWEVLKLWSININDFLIPELIKLDSRWLVFRNMTSKLNLKFSEMLLTISLDLEKLLKFNISCYLSSKYIITHLILLLLDS